MIEIPLSKQGRHKGKYIVIVDDVDKVLAKLNWRISFDKKNCYAIRNETGKYEAMHRVIMERVLEHEIPKGFVVDHIDGNGLNNQRSNLRLATHSQNAGNRRKIPKNKTGFQGVYQKYNKYESRISFTLGLFDTPEEAHEAYKKAHVEHFGKFSPFYQEV